VVEDSPAEEASLQEEDVIVKIDGRPVSGASDVARIVRRAQPGNELEVEFIREGKRKRVTVKVARRKGDWEYGYSWDPGSLHLEILKEPGVRMGVTLQDMDENLARYFKVKPGEGVLVVEVEEDSPAHEAGIRSQPTGSPWASMISQSRA
jgi:serine protease Do